MDGGRKIKSLYCTFLYIVLFLRRLLWITVLTVHGQVLADLTLLWPLLSGEEEVWDNG